MSPRSKTVFTLALLTAAGLGLAAVLVFAALDRLRARAAEANTDFVLTQLRDSVESSVSLGLALPEIRVAQDLIERERAGSPDILAIEIFTPDGESVFNTDRGSVGEPITEAWRTAIRRREPDGRWRVQEFGALVVGEQIRSDFGEPVGEIAITLSGAARDAHAEAVLGTLSGWFAFAIALAALAVGAIVLAVFRYAGRDLRAAARLLEEPAVDMAPARGLVGEAAAGMPVGTPAGTPADEDLVGLAAAMRRHVGETEIRVHAAADAVRQIDEDEERHAAA